MRRQGKVNQLSAEMHERLKRVYQAGSNFMKGVCHLCDIQS